MYNKYNYNVDVATLALGSQPRQRHCKGASQEDVRELSQEEVRECKKVWRSVREWTLTLPRQLALWEMESRWTPETSESDYRGQNPMARGVLYIIGKLLERKCLKWAHIVHLDIWNTSYGRKKGRESNCQFDFRPQKVGNRPDLLSCKGACHILLKSSWRQLQLWFRPHLNRRSARKVMGLQSRRSPNWWDFGTPTRESREK
jgi:hypothetical protein